MACKWMLIMNRLSLKRSIIVLPMIGVGILTEGSSPSAALINREFGIRTRFPSQLTVCRARSGSNPVGFYAWLTRRTDCEMPRPDRTSSISITASYNASFRTGYSLEFCRDGPAPSKLRINLRTLAFPHHPSGSCVKQNKDGSVEVLVVTQGGRGGGKDIEAGTAGVPKINYQALLRTRPNRLEKDLLVFRKVLQDTKVRPYPTNPL
jgi:hypothetical protein